MPLDPDAPFVVANSRKRFGAQVALGVAVTVLPIVFMAAVGFTLILFVCALLGLAVVAVSVWSLRNTAPVLSADSEGVSLQALPGPEGVRTFRWDGIEAIFTHRISRQFRMLCVLPKDLDGERRWAGDRAATLQKSVERIGAPYSVNLVAAGLSEQEALQRLSALASGRVSVGDRPSG